MRVTQAARHDAGSSLITRVDPSCYQAIARPHQISAALCAQGGGIDKSTLRNLPIFRWIQVVLTAEITQGHSQFAAIAVETVVRHSHLSRGQGSHHRMTGER